MNKEISPLEVSKQLKDFIFELELGNVDKLFVKGSFDIIEKSLKALEIIKKKEVWLAHFKGFRKLKTYNEHTLEQLTQEEWDLLKEVLL